MIPENPDVMLISESNVFNSDQDFELITPGYTMLKSRTCEVVNHCRLVALVREGLQLEVMHNWMSTEISSIWFKISSRGCKTLYLGGIYREHSILQQDTVTDSEPQQISRWKFFIDQWTKANRLGDCVIMGDTNLDHLKWGIPDPINTIMTNLVKNGPESEGACQLIVGPTRFWPTQKDSLLDQIWTNCPHRIVTSSNVPHSASDHNIIETQIKLKGKIGSAKTIRKRSMKNWNPEIYKKLVSEINWENLYNSTDVNLSYGIFEEQLRNILDKLAPMTNIQLCNNYKPWVNQEIKDLMEIRDTNRESARKSQLPADWNIYKQSRNLCNIKLRKTKDEYLKNLYKKLEKTNDISKMYKTTRQQLGWKTGTTPDSFLVDGRRISSPLEIANLQLKNLQQKK